jgi:hypothetical protein
MEQQPLSALEAAAAGKPLLLGDRAYAKQKYFRNARLVDPSSISSIEEGLSDILLNPQAHLAPKDVVNECNRDLVGAAYLNLFKTLANL